MRLVMTDQSVLFYRVSDALTKIVPYNSRFHLTSDSPNSYH